MKNLRTYKFVCTNLLFSFSELIEETVKLFLSGAKKEQQLSSSIYHDIRLFMLLQASDLLLKFYFLLIKKQCALLLNQLRIFLKLFTCYIFAAISVEYDEEHSCI